MPTNKCKNTVYSEHSFYWDTELSEERMEEIAAWLGNLPFKERRYISDLIEDTVADEQFYASGEV